MGQLSELAKSYAQSKKEKVILFDYKFIRGIISKSKRPARLKV
jgi:hypothetical protein